MNQLSIQWNSGVATIISEPQELPPGPEAKCSAVPSMYQKEY